MALVPFIDRGVEKACHTRKTILTIGVIVAFLIIGLSLYAWIAPVQKHDHPGQMEHQHDKSLPHNPTPLHTEGDDHH
jgi:quinol-cytochrome oxidoreductase complex cytochrome b subunit